MRYFYETINIPVRPKGRHHQHSSELAQHREQIILYLSRNKNYTPSGSLNHTLHDRIFCVHSDMLHADRRRHQHHLVRFFITSSQERGAEMKRTESFTITMDNVFQENGDVKSHFLLLASDSGAAFEELSLNDLKALRDMLVKQIPRIEKLIKTFDHEEE